MRQVAKLKVVIACYLCYMLGGFLSALFTRTDNWLGSIIALAVPTVVAMICFMVLTQQVQPAKKKLPSRTSRVVKARNLKVVR
jgi:cyanate permease